MSSESDNHHQTCPKCESKNVVEIIYGMPSPELQERAERDEVAIGGCVVSDDNPKWKCLDCEKRFGQTSYQPDDEKVLDVSTPEEAANLDDV